MKTDIAATVILIGLIIQAGFSQVTISPELGISYLPFTLRGGNSQQKSNRIDFLIGVSGQLPIQEKWYINTRLSYVNREDIKLFDLTLNPDYLGHIYKHNDLNFDINNNYKFFENLHLGLGLSIIRKINSSIEVKYETMDDMVFNEDQFLYGTNINAIFNTNYISIIFSYTYLIQEEKSLYSATKIGKSRYDLILSVPVFEWGSRKK